MVFNLKIDMAISLCCLVVLVGSIYAMPVIASANDVSQIVQTVINNDIVNTSDEVIKIQVDGELLDVSPNPFIENSRTLIPLRAVMEKLGASVEWDGEKSAVKITKDHIIIELVVGENTAKIIQDKDKAVNEEIIKLEVPSRIIDDRTFIPVRFVSESLGAQVEWDQSRNTVVIETRDKIVIERPVDFEVVEENTLEESETVLKWYQENYKIKGIYQHIDREWMYALVSAGEKPTGGYSLRIDSITEVTPGTAYIYAVLTSPDKDSIVTQALTYPHVVVRFKNDNIEKVIWDLADAENMPEEIAVNVRREGSEEEIVAHKISGSKGLIIYLFPEFMLTQDEGFDILIPKPDSGYLPVSMTISRNTEDLSVDEALEKAMSFYPNVSFEPTIFDYTLSGNMETVKCVWGKLDNDWVICVGMKGEKGTVSAWGQGGAETSEGLQVLVLSQISTIVLQ